MQCSGMKATTLKFDEGLQISYNEIIFTTAYIEEPFQGLNE